MLRRRCRLAEAFLAELGAGTFDESMRYAFQFDRAPLILEGIPTLDLNADDTHDEEIHHQAADTIDRVAAHAIADAPGGSRGGSRAKKGARR